MLFNSYTKSILFNADKKSRFDIKNVAFNVKDRDNIVMDDYNRCKTNAKESYLIDIVKNILEEHGQINQQDLIEKLKNMGDLSQIFGMGEVRIRNFIKDYSNQSEWIYQKEGKNATCMYYSPSKYQSIKTSKQGLS